MVASESAQARADGEVIDCPHPEFIRKTKLLVRLPGHFLEFEKRRRWKNQSPDLLQTHKTKPELFDHWFDVNCSIVVLRIKPESESRYRFRTTNALPLFRRQLHLSEQRADRFRQYSAQIRRRLFPDLWPDAEQSLTEFEPTMNCFECGTQVHRMTPYFTIPFVFGKTVPNKS